MMEHHQKCKGESAESSLLELCRATQYFDDGTSKCKRAVGSLSVMEKNHKTHLIAVGFDDVGKSLQKGQRHEFNPSVVAMADRMLITVWIMIFQVSLFFIGSLVKGLVFSLFYFGCWLLAVGCWLLAV